MSTLDGQKGFALVSVLWVVTLLMMIVTTVATIGLAQRRVTAFDREHLSVQLLTEAAINDAIARLLDADRGGSPRVDGVPYEFAIDGTNITVTVRDEAGKVDINQADTALLERLLVSAADVPQSTARALAAAINDWRLARRRNGLPSETIAFERIEELRAVTRVTEGIFNKLRPYLTVHGHHPIPNPLTAALPVLRAIDPPDGRSVEFYLKLRTSGGIPGALILNGIPQSGLSMSGWAFEITARIDTNSLAYTRSAVVRLTDRPARPYWLESWVVLEGGDAPS
jgi:general secretion pathway protein K